MLPPNETSVDTVQRAIVGDRRGREKRLPLLTDMNNRQVAIVALAALLAVCSSPCDLLFGKESAERTDFAATYRVDLAAFNLGDFRLTAKLTGSEYKLQAKGDFSFITRMIYRASGNTESAGKLSKAGAEPSRFRVIYKGGSKKEERRFSFTNGAVDQVYIVPCKKPNPRNVPITADQLAHVLDPLTAAFLSVRSEEALSYLNICQRTVPVFDGKLRFDIILTPKRSEGVGERRPAGLFGPLAVCRVSLCQSEAIGLTIPASSS